MAEGGVSILVATYNGARYIHEQLRSILGQASPDDEIIVVDDCSSDETPDILADYAKRNPGMKVVRNDRNLGVRGTFETLLGRCTKSIIFLSDQDDIWTPGRKAGMIEVLHREGCVAVLANSLVMTDGQIGGVFFPDTRDPNVGSVWSNFVKNNFIGCGMAFRREVLEVALPFPGTISMHDWWVGTCAMAIGRVCYMAVPSLLYRRHSDNQSPSKRRRWRIVLKDRVGNLLALAALLRRIMRLRRAGQ